MQAAEYLQQAQSALEDIISGVDDCLGSLQQAMGQ